MKVIDLLNKIATGEEVPKKIKYDNKYYTYNKEQDDYEIFTICHYDYLLDGINTFSSLNDEVEIIEEPKDNNFTGLKMYQNGQEVCSINYSSPKVKDEEPDLFEMIDDLYKEEKPKHIEGIKKSYKIFDFNASSFEAMKYMIQDIYDKQEELRKAVNYLLDKEEK